jgi:hypothetical protein
MYYCTCIQCCAVLVLVLDRGTDYFILYMTHLSAICLYDMHSRICKTIVNTSREVLTSSHRIPLFPVSFCTAPPYFHHHHKHFIGVLFRCVVCCLGLLFVFCSATCCITLPAAFCFSLDNPDVHTVTVHVPTAPPTS